MALPADYWRNAQMHNVFRTKPCQRLLRSGTCAWGSQCQFSHSLRWPRRPHRGNLYSPQVCPHVVAAFAAAAVSGADVSPERACPAGAKCNFAHSKEEVLYHPSILKTCLCEEHAQRQGSSSGSRGRRRRHCHRHYCPFAHGAKELRASTMPAEQREQILLEALNTFPANWCCSVCDPQQTKLPPGAVNPAAAAAAAAAVTAGAARGPPADATSAAALMPTLIPPWPPTLTASHLSALQGFMARDHDAKDEEDDGDETDTDDTPFPPVVADPSQAALPLKTHEWSGVEFIDDEYPLQRPQTPPPRVPGNAAFAPPTPGSADWKAEEERLAMFLGL